MQNAEFDNTLGLWKTDLIPLYPLLSKGGNPVSSLWQREVGRDFGAWRNQVFAGLAVSR
jgi:hypothetical protein